MGDLEEMLLRFFDGYRYFTLGTREFDGAVELEFDNRDRFQHFIHWMEGGCYSDDDESCFDPRPWLIDIGYSDMVILFDPQIKNLLTNY